MKLKVTDENGDTDTDTTKVSIKAKTSTDETADNDSPVAEENSSGTPLYIIGLIGIVLLLTIGIYGIKKKNLLEKINNILHLRRQK